jgi:peptidoglycan glycosyltransferase
VNDPKIAISVIVENKGSGSEYALPIAEKVFDAYFK